MHSILKGSKYASFEKSSDMKLARVIYHRLT